MQTEIKGTALAVRQWRRENTGPMTGLPIELQKRVVKLLEHHTWDEVCDAVGVNRAQLSTWRSDHKDKLQLRTKRRERQRPKRIKTGSKEAVTKPTFVELPVPTCSPQSDLEVRLPNGVIVAANAAAGVTFVGNLVLELIQGGQAAR